MTNQRTGIAHDPHPIRTGWRNAYRGPYLILVLALFGLSCWGTLDSFTDVDGDRVLAALPMVAPAVLAGWYVLVPAWKRQLDYAGVMVRFIVSGFVIALPLIAANAVFAFGAWLVPANRRLVQNPPDGDHYWWDGGLGSHLLMTSLMGWIAQMLGALAVFMIITLPVLSLRRPDVVNLGSHLMKVGDESKRNRLTALVFCGLTVFFVGLTVAAFTEGLDGIPELIDDFIWSLRSLIRYGDLQDLPYLIGVVLMIVGIGALGWASVDVIRARVAAARNETNR